MNTRNWLTLIGGICLAIGPVMQINSPNPTLFWVGMVVNTLGGALMAAKSFTTTEDKK